MKETRTVVVHVCDYCGTETTNARDMNVTDTGQPFRLTAKIGTNRGPGSKIDLCSTCASRIHDTLYNQQPKG